VPKDFLREQKILHSNLKFEVPTEFGDETDVKESTVEAEPIENFGGKTEVPFVPTPLPDAAEEPKGLSFFLDAILHTWPEHTFNVERKCNIGMRSKYIFLTKSF
jgi:hypothetical protein